MGRTLIPRFRVELDFAGLKDADRHTMAAAIGTAAATSPLCAANATMAASAAAIVKKDGALAQVNTTVVNDKQKLRTDLVTEASARGDFDGEVRTYVALTQGDAKSPGDIHNNGLVALVRTPATQVPPAAPAQIDVIIPKRGHGRAIASVHETGTERAKYAAQSSLDPFGPTTWSQLGTGMGKTRTVTGASGTKVWVRFATVRGQLQSDWSVPVLITIP
jgi:hypothetical protein